MQPLLETKTSCTGQQTQQQANNEPYIQNILLIRGVIVILATVSMLYTECVEKIISDAPQNRKSFWMVELLAKSQQVVHFFHIYEGFANYISVKKRYSQISDVFFIILDMYVSKMFIISLFTLLACQLPNFGKDIGVSGRIVVSELMLVPKILHQDQPGNYVYHYIAAASWQQVVLTLIVFLTTEANKFLNTSIQVHKVLLFITVFSIFYFYVQLLQLGFHNESYEGLEIFSIYQRLDTHSYVFGSYLASKVFSFNYNEQDVRQTLKAPPAESAYGRLIIRACTNKILTDIYIYCLVIVNVLCAFYKESAVAGSVSFITRSTVYIMFECGYNLSAAMIILFCSVARTQRAQTQFDGYIARESDWILGASVFVVVLNLYLFDEIQFGPYSIVIVCVLTVGVFCETLVVASVFRCIFGSLYDVILGWISSSREKISLMMIRIVMERVISG